MENVYCNCPPNYNCTVCKNEYKCFKMDDVKNCDEIFLSSSMVFGLCLICFFLIFCMNCRDVLVKDKTEIIDIEVNKDDVEPIKLVEEETEEEEPPDYHTVFGEK